MTEDLEKRYTAFKKLRDQRDYKGAFDAFMSDPLILEFMSFIEFKDFYMDSLAQVGEIAEDARAQALEYLIHLGSEDTQAQAELLRKLQKHFGSE